jgi:hypothetical protein
MGRMAFHPKFYALTAARSHPEVVDSEVFLLVEKPL